MKDAFKLYILPSTKMSEEEKERVLKRLSQEGSLNIKQFTEEAEQRTREIIKTHEEAAKQNRK